MAVANRGKSLYVSAPSEVLAQHLLSNALTILIYLVVLFSGMQPWRSAVLEWDQDPYRCKQTRLSCAKEAG